MSCFERPELKNTPRACEHVHRSQLLLIFVNLYSVRTDQLCITCCKKNGKIQTKKATRLKKQNKKNCNVRFEGGITCVISKFWKIVPSDVNQFESERIYKQKKKAQVKASCLIPNPNMDKVCWKCTHNLQMLKTGGNACLSH